MMTDLYMGLHTHAPSSPEHDGEVRYDGFYPIIARPTGKVTLWSVPAETNPDKSEIKFQPQSDG